MSRKRERKPSDEHARRQELGVRGCSVAGRSCRSRPMSASLVKALSSAMATRAASRGRRFKSCPRYKKVASDLRKRSSGATQHFESIRLMSRIGSHKPPEIQRCARPTLQPERSRWGVGAGRAQGLRRCSTLRSDVSCAAAGDSGGASDAQLSTQSGVHSHADERTGDETENRRQSGQ